MADALDANQDITNSTKPQRNSVNLPYVLATSRIGSTLEQIIKASVPDRFTQDFLTTKLGIKGGSGMAMLPFLKKIGFVGSDGIPTEIYKDFRIESTRGSAMARAVIEGYALLSQMNEYFYDLSDKELRDLVVRATGAQSDSRIVAAVVNTIKSLKEYAAFDSDTIESTKDEVFKPSTIATDEVKIDPDIKKSGQQKMSLNNLKLGYTINLNLPATSDIAVYNAIFKSLKDNIFDE